MELYEQGQLRGSALYNSDGWLLLIQLIEDMKEGALEEINRRPTDCVHAAVRYQAVCDIKSALGQFITAEGDIFNVRRETERRGA